MLFLLDDNARVNGAQIPMWTVADHLLAHDAKIAARVGPPSVGPFSGNWLPGEPL